MSKSTRQDAQINRKKNKTKKIRRSLQTKPYFYPGQETISDLVAQKSPIGPALSQMDEASRARLMIEIQRGAGNQALVKGLQASSSPETVAKAAIQRDDGAQTGGGTVVGQTWLDVLPRARNLDQKRGITSVESERGKTPSLKYAPENKIEVTPGTAPPEGEVSLVTGDGISPKEQVLQKINAARAGIQSRDIVNDPFVHKGNFYKPEGAVAEENPYETKPQRVDKEAVEYNEWQPTAVPTVNFDPNNDTDKKKWAIFNRTMTLEGTVGTVTAAAVDKTLTIGVGFSSGGKQAQSVMNKVFTALPELKQAAFEAGLALDGDKFIVVDTDKKWILEGNDATNYIETNKSLLSFIINIGIGAQSLAPGEEVSEDESVKERQAMLNAQWQTFLSRALSGIEASGVLNWPLNSAVLAVHSRHGLQGTFPWSFWQSHANPDLRAMVRAIYDQLKATNQRGWFEPISGGGMYRSYYLAVKAEVAAEEKAAQEAT